MENLELVSVAVCPRVIRSTNSETCGSQNASCHSEVFCLADHHERRLSAKIRAPVGDSVASCAIQSLLYADKLFSAPR
jgi:hypothetical protein